MLEVAPLLAVTALFIGIFVYGTAQIQVKEIAANWEQMRCEPAAILFANLVAKEKDPNANPSEFASENFQFCIGKIIDASVGFAMTPVMQMFNQQMKATEPIQASTNGMRDAAAGYVKPLNGLFQLGWNKFRALGQVFSRMYFKLYSAFDRVFGVAVAALFGGMAMYKSIQNMMGFVIQVVIAIITMLSVLVILLWFVMWPVIPIILTMIGVLSATVHAANVSGLRGSFCVAPTTKIRMRNGGTKAVRDLVPGDELEKGVVEGILMTVCEDLSCYKIGNVVISGSHLVQGLNSTWVPASQHPDAVEWFEPPKMWVCLNTSSHEWTTASGLVLRDWEELPDGQDKAWETLVHEMLNPGRMMWMSAPGRGLLGGGTRVYEMEKGPVPLRSICLGDRIKDHDGKFVKVLGFYTDNEIAPVYGPNKAAWIWDGPRRLWTHPHSEDEAGPLQAEDSFHLITESGTFVITGNTVVRDFTEVGIHHLHKTYPFVEKVLSQQVE
jgi:hypothetical protein